MTMSDEPIDMAPLDPLALAFKELSDLGNAERLIARAKGKLRHVDGRGWAAFDGVRWSTEQGEVLATVAAHGVARGLKDELGAFRQAALDRQLPTAWDGKLIDAKLEALHRWGVTSGNANKSAAMLAQAASLVPSMREDFDRDPLALNCRNGTLRARRDSAGKWQVKISPHDPTDMISRVAEVEFDPAATCPRWSERLKVVLPVPGVRRYFRQAVGYALTGLNREQCIFLLQGKGGDGKSTTMDVIRQLLGGYGSSADVQTFMAGAARSGADASPDLARLSGDMRLCSTGEPRRGGQLDEAKIKSITGGSPIAARELHGDLFEYVPKFKLFLECNAKPRISGDDDGIWRRIGIITFPVQFDGKDGRKPDKAIKDELLEEAPGILNWALKGMLEWLEAGELVQPPEVREAVEDYRRGANPFGEWFNERVDTRDAQAIVSAKELFDDYKAWCDQQGVGDREIMTSTMFGRTLGDRQLIKRKDRLGNIVRHGAKLRPRDGSAPLAEQPRQASAQAPPAGADGDPEDFQP